jgi:hypothetical protein
MMMMYDDEKKEVNKVEKGFEISRKKNLFLNLERNLNFCLIYLTLLCDGDDASRGK